VRDETRFGKNWGSVPSGDIQTGTSSEFNPLSPWHGSLRFMPLIGTLVIVPAQE
jgi:hypothetical protein